MTQVEFQKFYQQNKAAVIGFPVLLFLVLFNQFYLKPAREAKRLARSGGAPAVAATTTSGSAVPVAAVVETGPPPPFSFNPQELPQIPDLSNVFRTGKTYAFLGSYTNNIFIRKTEKTDDGNPFVPVVQEIREEVFSPDITYHGFLRMGRENVAILKLSGKLMLTKTGQNLFHTSFRLEGIYSDRVIMSDRSEGQKQFEIGLFEKVQKTTIRDQMVGEEDKPSGFSHDKELLMSERWGDQVVERPSR